MITHDPTDWIRPVFHFHKTDTFRKLLPAMVGISIFCAGVVFLRQHYDHNRILGTLKNITLMHSLLGFAISMLLVFRTNTAYDRWWEGRKLWGSLVNCSRNFAVKINNFLPKAELETRIWFATSLGLYCKELSFHLIKTRVKNAHDLPNTDFLEIDQRQHVPVQIVGQMIDRLCQLQQKQYLTEHQLLLLNPETTAFLDICGACERIKNTPIPYSYNAFIKKFIIIYCLTLPFGLVVQLEWLVIPVTVFVFYVLASLELIAEEIEDPFGQDSNDLPLMHLSRTIYRNVQQILQDGSSSQPSAPIETVPG
jgi:ion channel-forming bestrophin family protein